MHSLGEDDKLFFGIGLIFSFSTISCISVLIIYSENFKNKINEAVKKFNLIRLKSDDRKVQKYCNLAILQFESSRKFISCGLFELNWKHIFLMMTSFFSYLVMMIQFDYMLTLKQINILSGAAD